MKIVWKSLWWFFFPLRWNVEELRLAIERMERNMDARIQQAIDDVAELKDVVTSTNQGMDALEAINAEMPFLVRNLGGKWYFAGGNKSEVITWTDPTTGQTCTVDNKRHNKGLLWADFINAVRYERPELVRAMLHLHEPPCVVDDPTCSDEPASVVQDYDSGNALCPES